MPEGHTIHRIARDRGKLLAGRVVRVSSPQGRFGADAERVDGAVLEKRIQPYGKHLCQSIRSEYGNQGQGQAMRHLLPDQQRPSRH